MAIRNILFTVVVILLLLSGCSANEQPSQQPKVSPEVTEEPQESSDDITVEEAGSQGFEVAKGISALTGIPSDAPYRPVAIMIENHPDARPQTGLIHGDVVYEMYVEGKITRFLAIFNDTKPDTAGPVRSVRHYFFRTAREWQPILVHYGASSFAKDEYEKVGIKRLDGMVMGKPFWRDKSRKAPHNAYVSVKDAGKKIDFEPTSNGFRFTDAKIQGEDYHILQIPYRKDSNLVEYQLDRETGEHLRFINGEPHTDRDTGEQIRVRNIILQYAEHSSMNTKSGHIDIDFISSGRAEYFLNGKHLEGKWEKDSFEGRTVFYGPDQKEIELLPGNTWLQVMPRDMKIEIQ